MEMNAQTENNAIEKSNTPIAKDLISILLGCMFDKSINPIEIFLFQSFHEDHPSKKNVAGCYYVVNKLNTQIEICQPKDEKPVIKFKMSAIMPKLLLRAANEEVPELNSLSLSYKVEVKVNGEKEVFSVSENWGDETVEISGDYLTKIWKRTLEIKGGEYLKFAQNI